MKNRFTRSLIQTGRISLVATLWMAGHLQAAPNPETVLGVAPEALLSQLPQPPEGWKLVSSTGLNEISALPALLTFAIREYRLDPPPPAPGLPASPPKLTKITLLDTAFDSDRAFVFDVFKQPASGDTRHSTFQGARVVERKVGETKRTITAAFDSRFIVSVTLQNQDDKDRDAWLTALDFEKISAWAKQAPKIKPPADLFKVSYVNEMNPKSNQTLSVPTRRNAP